MPHLTEEQYVQQLAAKVAKISGKHNVEITQAIVEEVIDQALYQINRDIRSGEKAKLMYVGTIQRDNKMQAIRFTGDEYLFQPLKPLNTGANA